MLRPKCLQKKMVETFRYLPSLEVDLLRLLLVVLFLKERDILY